MSRYSPLLENMHQAILENEATLLISSIKRNPRISPEKQMAIYTDGYRIRLLQTVCSDYPALLALLGENPFDQLAKAYIEKNPPAHFNLDRYPHPFADFVRAYAGDDFAADLATLEAAIARVFMLEESAPLNPAALAGLTPEQFGELLLAPRTASTLLHLNYPAHRYILDMRESDAAKRPASSPEYIYLVRHANEVRRHMLSQAEYETLSQLSSGKTVAAALDEVTMRHPELLPEIADNLQSWFARWTGNGFFSAGKADG